MGKIYLAVEVGAKRCPLARYLGVSELDLVTQVAVGKVAGRVTAWHPPAIIAGEAW